MAYMSQETKAKIQPTVKAIMKAYGIKGTMAVRNHSTLVLNISEGKLDFIANFNRVCGKNMWYARAGFEPQRDSLDVNPYHFRDHFDGECRDFLTEIFAAMNTGNWDESDIQTDYFNVGWYVDVNIGRWNKPYKVV